MNENPGYAATLSREILGENIVGQLLLELKSTSQNCRLTSVGQNSAALKNDLPPVSGPPCWQLPSVLTSGRSRNGGQINNWNLPVQNGAEFRVQVTPAQGIGCQGLRR